MKPEKNLIRSTNTASVTMSIVALLLAIIGMILLKEPVSVTHAQASGTSMLAAPVGEPGSDPGHINPVLRYEVTGTGPLSQLTSIPPTPDSSVNDPIAVA